MASKDPEFDGAWTDGEEIDEIDDLEEISEDGVEAEYDPPLKVEPAAFDAPRAEVDEATGVTQLPFDVPNTEPPPADAEVAPRADAVAAAKSPASASQANPTFDAAVRQALQAPGQPEHWDKLEQLAKNLDRASDVAAAYREALGQKLDHELALDLIDRAVQFHDEWLDDPEDVSALLMTVLEIEPAARWAFDRISLKLTVEARWDELLALYDKVIAATSQNSARLQLLDEAAAVAKDCAGNPERAVDYLMEVFSLRPTDHQIGAALERLLKQQRRYRDLIQFWTMRLDVLAGQDALATRQQIAACWLEDLNDPNGALAAVEPLLDDPRTASTAGNLLEMILGSATSTKEVRTRALELLSDKYDGTKRWRQVVHALEVALPHVPEGERVQIHREIARRLVEHEAHDEALMHLAALVALAPEIWTDDRLRRVLRGDFNEDVAGCKPVIDRERGRKLLHLAAERAGRATASRDRAIALYRALLDDKPDDVLAINSLTKLYSGAERTEDLLELRQHELGLAEDVDKRLALRLQIASLLGSMNDEAAAIQTLRDNLDERGDHEPTLEALIHRLQEQEKHEDLADLLTTQAALSEQLQRGDLAARLWMRAAHVSKANLFDLERAVDCFQRVVDLQPNLEALDELATIFVDRKQHAAAVQWLQRRWELTDPGQRTPTTVRLARAHIEARQLREALSCLQTGLTEDPASLELRDLLADLHRRDGAYSELVEVLLEGAKRSSDNDTRHRYLVEAADVLQRGLRSPERAVPVLEQVVKLQPKDREVRVALADALRASGKLNESRALASQLIEEYGRRHPPQRAKLHLLLAQVLRAQGDATQAVKQLELGVTMDMGNLQLQHMLGQVYRETGELQKAERAYHALVLLLRRRSAINRGPLQNDDVGIAEALFELHLVAKDLGADERASENLESAFDAAAQDPEEAAHFERVLRATGDAELLLRSLERRLATAESAAERARIYAEIATAQETQLDQPEAALMSLIRALEEAPGAKELYERAQALAQQTGELEDYAAMLEKLSDRALDEGDSELACRLLMQLGALEENDRRDFTRAANLYARAEECGHELHAVWSARARVAACLDDEAVELEMLRNLIEGDAEWMQTPERTDALYRLSDLELARRESLRDGVATLTKALEAEPRYEHAARTLQAALVLEPDSEAVTSALENVARASSDDALLLEALCRKAELSGVQPDSLREAVEVADRLEDTDKAEVLLLRAVEVAKDAGDMASALWALQRLAVLREAQGDMRDAVHWLTEAADVADPDESRAMTLRVARIAGGPLEDLDVAADAYQRILQHEPGEPSIWQPLLDVLRRIGDKERLERFLESTVEDVFDVPLRCELRIEHASLLREQPDRRDGAVELLRGVLEDDADHAQAAEMLADLLLEAGRTDELVELLERQLEASKERSDALSGVRFALRLADAHGEGRKADALRTFRETLAWIPENAQLLRGLIDRLDPREDAAERANLIEKLLATGGGGDAMSLAIELIDVQDKLEDRTGLERAIEAAFKIDPGDQRVLIHMQRLAESLEEEAKRLPPGDEAVSMLLRAASIQLDRLDDPASAGELLTTALAMRPADLGILHQLVDALLRSGQPQTAVDRVTAALDNWTGAEADRARLHRVRADIWSSSGHYDSAMHDLEHARTFEGDAVLPELVEAVKRAREAASERSDFDAQRATTLRLAALLKEMNEPERAREVISRWVTDTPDDMEAIRSLLDMDRAEGRWEEVCVGCVRLVELEVGASRAEAALLHADACDQLGHPEAARESLERVFHDDPAHAGVRTRLRALYERLQEYRELSNLLLVDANHTEDEASRFELLREAGRMRLGSFEQAASAIGPLSEALELRPEDLEVTLLLADAYISAGLIQETVQLLQAGIDRQGGRRSRELSALQHRMARAAATSDRNNEMQWLLAAFESYPQGTDVASELADLATELGHYDIALKALRALATAKTQGTISRPMAFLKQAQIARLQGDDRKATFLVKKAISMDPEFAEARDFLDQLGPT